MCVDTGQTLGMSIKNMMRWKAEPVKHISRRKKVYFTCSSILAASEMDKPGRSCKGLRQCELKKKKKKEKCSNIPTSLIDY